MDRYKQARHAMAYGANKDLIDLLLRHDCPAFNLEEARKVYSRLVKPNRFTGNK